MTNQQTASSSKFADNEVGLPELLAALWKARLLILSVVAVFVVLAILYLNVATYKYTAELKVTPSQSSGGERSGMGGLAGLASIAGVNLKQGGGATPFQLYLEGVKSRPVANDLATHPEIMKVVFAAEWDRTTGHFAEHRNAAGNIMRSFKRALGIPSYPWRTPDGSRLQIYIQNNVSITESPKSPAVTIAFSHPDAKFAAYFLNTLHKTLDQTIRQKALVRSQSYISYLTDKLPQVTVVEHRLALVQVLNEQENFRMMASSGNAYAADPFGDATSSLTPTSPRPTIVIGLSIVLGLVVGSLSAAVRWIFRDTHADNPSE